MPHWTVLQRILRQLNTSELVIYLIAQMIWQHHQSLDATLIQIENAISGINPNEIDLITEWQERVIILVAKYSSVQSLDLSQFAQHQTNLLIRYSSIDHNWKKSIRPTPSANFKEINQMYLSITTNQSVNRQKDSICSFLTSIFLKFNNVSNISEMEQLLILITKIHRLISRFWRDVTLHSSICSSALTKLTTDQQKLFIQIYGSNSSLWNVSDCRRFVQRLILDFYARLDKYKLNNTLPSSEGMRKCKYCKDIGHVWDECMRRKSLLCLNCLQFGHLVNRCSNDRVKSNNILLCDLFSLKY